jgi:hypothetical protein
MKPDQPIPYRLTPLGERTPSPPLAVLGAAVRREARKVQRKARAMLAAERRRAAS